MNHASPRIPRPSFADVEPLESRRLLAAVKVMPLGDSITNAFVGDASYRFWLYKQLKLGGYDVDFVGTRKGVYDDAAQVNAGQPRYNDFDQDHEGNGGVRTDDILADLPRILAANVPDVVLLHAGSNDMFQSFDVPETVARLGQIIDRFRAANPSVTVLVAQVIPAKVLVENLQAMNALIPAMVASKDTRQSRVLAVDQFTGFSATADLKDEYHPNIFGENKIAAKWYAAMTRVLPAPPAPATPVKYLTEIRATSATNGFGPVEIDRSAGDAARNDGGAINLNGVSTIRGLGTHAPSDITYTLGGAYTRFLADVGVDDEVGANGSVVFKVFVDDVLRFDSGVMTGATATKSIDVSVAGAQRLRLIATDAGNGNVDDHADWANARLTLAAPQPQPQPQPTPNPNPDPTPNPNPDPNPNPTPEPTPQPAAPNVTASAFVFKTRPHKLKFTFSADVSASLGRDDLVVTNRATGKTIRTRAIAMSYDAGSNMATFTFPGLKKGQLPDGTYRATLRASGIHNSEGTKLANDHAFDFFFLSGDADHDGTVDRDDFNILRDNFRKSGRDFSQGDFNYDGKVSESDFAILARRFGASFAGDAAAAPTGKRRSTLINSLRDALKDKPAKNRANKKDDDADERDGDDRKGSKSAKKKDAEKKRDKSNKGKGRAGGHDD